MNTLAYCQNLLRTKKRVCSKGALPRGLVGVVFFERTSLSWSTVKGRQVWEFTEKDSLLGCLTI